MLVLTRKQNEQIRIGKEITVTVIRTKGKAVRLGIEAPAHIGVLRGELVFDSEEESATTGEQAKQEKLSKPAAERRVNAVRQAAAGATQPTRMPGEQVTSRTAPKGVEADWPTGQQRQQVGQERAKAGESVLGAATISAVTMRQFMDSRVGV